MDTARQQGKRSLIRVQEVRMSTSGITERNTNDARHAPGRPRSMESEQAILDAAMVLLVQHGYNGLTLDKVAAEACVSKATIYRRWRSKEEMVIAALGAIPPIHPRLTGAVVDNLTDFIQQFIDMVRTTPGKRQAETRMVTMLPSLVAQCESNPELLASLRAYIEQRRLPVRQILEHALASGDLPELRDIDLLIDAIMGPVVMRIFHGAGDFSEAETRSLMELLIAGARALSPNNGTRTERQTHPRS